MKAEDTIEVRERIYAIATGLQSAGLAFVFVKLAVDPIVLNGLLHFLEAVLIFFKLSFNYWGVVIAAAVISLVTIPSGAWIANLTKNKSVSRPQTSISSLFAGRQFLLWSAMTIFVAVVFLGLFDNEGRLVAIAIFVLAIAVLHVAECATTILGYRLRGLDGRTDREAVLVQMIGLFFALVLLLGGLLTVDFQKPDPVIKVLVEIEAVVNK